MPTILILSSILCAGIGLPVVSTALFCVALFLWERRRKIN